MQHSTDFGVSLVWRTELILPLEEKTDSKATVLA